MHTFQIPQSLFNQHQLSVLQTSYSTKISADKIVFQVPNLSAFDQTISKLQLITIEKIELPISGLSCDGCASSASRILNLQNGVIHASVDFAQSKAIIYCIRNTVSLIDLNNAIEVMGYKLGV